MSTEKKEMSYKDAMAEIESIIEKLNNGELDIDKVSEDVKRATQLVVLCKSKLKRSESEIKKLFELE